MRGKLWVASIGLVALAAMVCEDASKRATGVSRTCYHDKDLRTYEQWRQTVTFPYAAPEAKLRRVKDEYSLIGVGSSKEEVLKAFGPPDFEEELYPKRWRPPCVGYAFVYYFEKPQEMSNVVKDKNIEVFFTRDGRVRWIVGNIGLPEKGGYARQP